MAKKKAAAAKLVAKKAAAASDSLPRAFNSAEDHAVYREDGRKLHVNGGWLRQNWASVVATALRITSIATGKVVFSRVADVTGGVAGAEK